MLRGLQRYVQKTKGKRSHTYIGFRTLCISWPKLRGDTFFFDGYPLSDQYKREIFLYDTDIQHFDGIGAALFLHALEPRKQKYFYANMFIVGMREIL